MPAPTLIIGGGIVGSCTALFLAPHAEVIVLEKDPSYQFASTTLSAASFRQQFSLAVNLHMSRFGAAFLEERAERVGLVRRAYLILATAAGDAQLKANRQMQLAEGAKVALFEGPAAIAERFPWLNTEDVVCATLGLANEGWFDAYSLLRAVREEAIAAGARYIADEAVAIDRNGDAVTAVRTAKGERIAASHVVIAAGRHSGSVAAMAGVSLPVEPRKRTVFVLRAPLDNAGMPLMFDTTGAWLRPEGEGFIGGISPQPDNDPNPGEDFDPDIDQLEDLGVAGSGAPHPGVGTVAHGARLGRPLRHVPARPQRGNRPASGDRQPDHRRRFLRPRRAARPGDRPRGVGTDPLRRIPLAGPDAAGIRADTRQPPDVGAGGLLKNPSPFGRRPRSPCRGGRARME